MTHRAQRGWGATIVVAFASLLFTALGAKAEFSPLPYYENFTYTDSSSLVGSNGWSVFTTGPGVGYGILPNQYHGWAGYPGGEAVASNAYGRLAGMSLLNKFGTYTREPGMGFPSSSGEFDKASVVTVRYMLDLSNATAPTNALSTLSRYGTMFWQHSRWTYENPSTYYKMMTTVRYFVKTNGLVNAYNGHLLQELSHTPITGPTRMMVTADYVTKRWSLWVGDELVVNDFDMYKPYRGSTATDFTHMLHDGWYKDYDGLKEIGFVDNTGDGHTLLDEVRVFEGIPSSKTMPLIDNFETRVMYGETINVSPGNLNGQYGWFAHGGTVAAEAQNTENGAAGVLGVQLAAGGEAFQLFLDGQTNVWTDFWLRPVVSGSGSANIDAGGGHAVFSINDAGSVSAYNGVISSTVTSVTATAWSRFTVQADYVTRTWDLYVDGALVQAGLAFRSATSPDTYEEFRLSSTGTAVVQFDDIVINTESPFNIPSISFSSDTQEIGVGVTEVTVTATLSWAFGQPISVDYVLSDSGTAMQVYGYSAADGTLTFMPGETSKSFTFTINRDTFNYAEHDDALVFTLTNLLNVTMGTYDTLTQTIRTNPEHLPIIPFSESFEYRELGDLDGQRGWESTYVDVQSTDTYAGTKAARSTRLGAGLGYSFTNQAMSVVLQWRAKPVLAQHEHTPPAGSTYAFYVNTDGYIVAFDGATATNMGNVVTLNTNNWAYFRVALDHYAKTWNLSINETPVVTGFDFYDASSPSFSGMNVDGQVTIDNIEIGFGPPSTPTNLVAVAGEGQIGLSWSSAQGAVTYRLKRGTNPGGPYTPIASLSGTSYTDNSVLNNITYYYVVSALNTLGEGNNSAQASAVTRARVTGLAATAGIGQITLDWDAYPDATNYVVMRGTVSGGPYTPIATTNLNGYADTNVNNGMSYYYIVQAETATYSSLNSTEVSSMPALRTIFYDSFETPVVAGRIETLIPNWAIYKVLADEPDVRAGLWNEDSGSMVTPYGQQAAYVWSERYIQTTGIEETLEGDAYYRLSLNVAAEYGLGGIYYSVALYAGSTMLAEAVAGWEIAEHDLADRVVELEYTSPSNHVAIGETLAIRVKYASGEWQYVMAVDNVRLETAIDPPPVLPDPLTFSIAPAADSKTAISMTSESVTNGVGPILYKFENVTTTEDSGWAESTSWTDTGLSAGTLYGFRILARDVYGNENTWSAVSYAETLGANIMTNNAGADSWNTAANWKNGVVPTGEESPRISTNIAAVVVGAPPAYTGNLILDPDSSLEFANASAAGVLPGSAYQIQLNSGSALKAFTTVSINPAIVLLGNAEVQGGSSGNNVTFIGPISDAGKLTLAGDSGNQFHFTMANSFSGGLATRTIAGTGHRVYAHINGSFGTGDVAINTNASLFIGAGITNAIADTAILSLTGAKDTTAASKVVLDSSETVFQLFVDGSVQPRGTHGASGSGADYESATLFSGSGILTVTVGADEIYDLSKRDITESSAVLEGKLDVPYTNRTVRAYWSTNNNVSSANWLADTAADTAIVGTYSEKVGQALLHGLINLVGNTTYYYTFSASNSSDVVWGATDSFETVGPPVLSNPGVSATGDGTATLAGLLTAGSFAEVTFVWGTTDAGTNSTLNWPNRIAKGMISQGTSFSSALASLTYGVQYQYRIFGENVIGTAWADAQPFYSTIPKSGATVLVNVAGTSATNVAQTTATLLGTLNAPRSVFTVHAYWSTNNNVTISDWTNDTSKGSTEVGAYTNVSGVALSVPVNGLTHDKNYYYTFMMTNPVTNIWAASNVSFATVGSPAVDSSAGASNVVGSAVNLRAELTDGFAADAYFVWDAQDRGTGGTNAWPNVVAAGSVTEGNGFGATVTGFVYGVQYTYRVFVTNQYGSGWSVPQPFYSLPSVAPVPLATGGVSTNLYTAGDGKLWYAHIFTAGQTFTASEDLDVEYLIVAGGGGGGGVDGTFAAGGGGAGGLRTGTQSITSGGYPVVVGAGGSGGVGGYSVSETRGGNGGLSSVFGISAAGGGGGGNNLVTTGRAGGSGGGGSTSAGVGGAGTSGQGNAGGASASSPTLTGGGGGGAGGVGGTPAGGVGLTLDFTGSNVTYATGGKGGVRSTAYSVVGAANTGNGGSGGAERNNDIPNRTGAAGGSGIVIVRYEVVPGADLAVTNTTFTNVMATSVGVIGAIDAFDAKLDVKVYWSTTDHPSAAAWLADGTASNTYVASFTNVTDAAINHTLAGLTQGTTYYYTFMATNVLTNIWASPNMEFGTKGAPTATTASGATSATYGSVTLQGLLTAGGEADAYMVWDTADRSTTSTGAWAHVETVGTQLQGFVFDQVVTGLLYGVQYSYRVYVTNEYDVGWSAAATFKSTIPESGGSPLVAVRNATVSNIGATSVNLNGELDATQSVFTVTAYWSTTNHASLAAWQAVPTSQSLGAYTNVMGQALTLPISGLAAETRYYYTFVASNVSTNLQATPNAYFYTQGNTAVDTAGGATAIGAGTAGLRGLLTAGGVADATFVWGDEDGLTGSTNDWDYAATVGEVAQAAVFTNTVSNLLYGVEYHYRVYVTNAINAAWSSSTNFTTTLPAGVNIANQPVANVGTTAADLQGALNATQSVFTVYAFWSTNNNLTASDWTNDTSKLTAEVGTYTNVVGEALVVPASGLDTVTTYYYTFMASNVVGEIWATPNASFSTVDAPAVTATGATSTGVGSVSLGGNLTAGYFADATLVWSTTHSGTGSTQDWANIVPLGVVTQGIAFAAPASGLLYGVDYYYRVYVTNEANTAWSSEVAFMAAIPESSGSLLVGAEPTSAANIGAFTADLQGTLNATQSVFSVIAYWSTTNHLTSAAWVADTNKGSSAALGPFTNVTGQAVSLAASGLQQGQTYYYTLVASNSVTNVWAESSNASFATQGAPTVDLAGGAINVTPASATLRGVLTVGGVADGFFAWGDNQPAGADVMGNWDTVIPMGQIHQGITFSQEIAGLDAPQLYHYRVFATNPFGTNYSDVSSFSTPDLLNIMTAVAGAPNSWNTAANWSRGIVPAGTDWPVINTNLAAQIDAGAVLYSGGLQLRAGASLQILNRTTAELALGTNTITMFEGSSIKIDRDLATYTYPAIRLLGNATLDLGGSTTKIRRFSKPITGAYTLRMIGNNTHSAELNAANTYTNFVADAGGRYIIKANAAGSLGLGDVTINKVADGNDLSGVLEVNATGVMSTNATLSLNGKGWNSTTGGTAPYPETAYPLHLNTDMTVRRLFVNGYQAKAGTYTSTASFVGGSGTLTVLESPSVASVSLISFVDDVNGGPIWESLRKVNYTLTFDVDVDESTVTTNDFGNAGGATITFGALTKLTTHPAPAVFTLEVIPTSAGTLQLEVKSGEVIQDVYGNTLSVPEQDDTTITINAGMATLIDEDFQTPLYANGTANPAFAGWTLSSTTQIKARNAAAQADVPGSQSLTNQVLHFEYVSWARRNIQHYWETNDVYLLSVNVAPQNYNIAVPRYFAVKLQQQDGTEVWNSGAVTIPLYDNFGRVDPWPESLTYTFRVDAADFATGTEGELLRFEITDQAVNANRGIFIDNISLLLRYASAFPVLSSTVPVDDAVGVTLGSNLQATFSANMAIGSGNITLRNVTDGTDTVISVTDAAHVSVAGAVLTIVPPADLLGSKDYAVLIDSGALTVSGDALLTFKGISDANTWNFTTTANAPGYWTGTVDKEFTRGLNWSTDAMPVGQIATITNGIGAGLGPIITNTILTDRQPSAVHIGDGASGQVIVSTNGVWNPLSVQLGLAGGTGKLVLDGDADVHAAILRLVGANATVELSGTATLVTDDIGTIDAGSYVTLDGLATLRLPGDQTSLVNNTDNSGSVRATDFVGSGDRIQAVYDGSTWTDFTVVGPPQVDADIGASALGIGTATLNGTVITAGRVALQDVSIYLGAADGGTNPANWDTNIVFSVGVITEGVAFSTNLTGLLYGIQYNYRVFASNAYGTVWSDPVETFQTLAPVVGVTNTAAANILTTTADLQGTLDAPESVFTVTAYWSTNNNADATAWTNDSTKDSAPVGTFTNVAGYSLSVAATGLTIGTNYYYTLVASNAVTTIWATPNASFTTANELPPVVGVGSGADPVAYVEATLHGVISVFNGVVNDVRIYLGGSDGGTDPLLWDTNYVFDVSSLTENVAFSTNLTGLTEGSNYFYRVYATNAYGDAWSAPVEAFTTLTAADGTWLGVSGNWTNANVWVSNTVARGTDRTANFTGVNIAANQSITNDAATGIGHIVFTDLTTADRDLTIAGGSPLTLTVSSNTPTINVTQSGRTLTIGAPLAGTQGLTKTGPGTLTLSGTNTFSGGTFINGGVLKVTATNSALGSSGNITFDGTATLSGTAAAPYTLGALTINSGTATIEGSSSRNYNFTTLSGSGKLSWKGGAGSPSLSVTDASTFTGAIELGSTSAGSQTIQVPNLKDEVGAGNIQMNQGVFGQSQTFKLNAGGAVGVTLSNRQIEFVAGGANAPLLLDNSSANAAATFVINTSLLNADNDGKILQLQGSNTGENEFAGAIGNGTGGGAVSLTKSGNGKWILSGTNTYTGNTTVSAGTLAIANSEALPDATHLLITSGKIVDLGADLRIDISALTLGGVVQPNGVYGSTASIATNTSAYFTGTGLLYVGVRSPAVRATSTANISTSTADLQGVLDAEVEAVTVTAYLSTTSNATAQAWSDDGTKQTFALGSFTNIVDQALTVPVTGLSGGTTYYYTFVASNAVTTAWAIPGASFETTSAPAVDNAGGATNMDTVSATLRGQLTAGGVANAYIAWGATVPASSNVLGNWDAVIPIGVVSVGEVFSAGISGLTQSSTYHYRCFVSNDVATAWSVVTNFVTAAPVVYTGPDGASNTDRWNTDANWDSGAGTVPSGNVDVVIETGRKPWANYSTPAYTGRLTLEANSNLGLGTTTGNNTVNALGTGPITLGSGSTIIMRYDANYTFNQSIVLAGAATISLSESTSGRKTRTFVAPISGNYVLTLAGSGGNITTLSASNSVAGITTTQATGASTNWKIIANSAGSLGNGDVTISDTVNLVVDAANVMHDSAALHLNGAKSTTDATKLVMNASDTIFQLYIDGVQQPGGAYTNGSASWISGAGTLTVTDWPSSITNTSASSVEPTTADLAGDLSISNETFDVVVYWSESNNVDSVAWLADGTASNMLVGSYSASSAVTGSVANLTPVSTYYYTLRATNALEDLWASSNVSFSTPGILALPVVTAAGGATDIGVGGATLNGLLTTGGQADATIVWGTADGDTNSISAWQNQIPMAQVNESFAFSSAVSGLLYGPQYAYRVYVTNSLGEAWSAVSSFSTLPPAGADAPAITNTTVTNITQTAADLVATLDATQSIFTVSVYWSESNNLDSATWLADGTASNMVLGTYTNVSDLSLTGAVANLTSGTAYYYTYLATNETTNIWASPNGAFGTVGTPSVDTASGAIGFANGATLNGRVIFDGNAALDDVRIYFGTTDGGTNATNWDTNFVFNVGDITVGNVFSTNVTDLLYGKANNYRVYASNSYGVGWSDVATVLSAPPEVPWTPALIDTVAWYDAADTNTMTFNGSTVSQWDDKSGNHNNVRQLTPASMPSYNSSDSRMNNKPTIGYDLARKYLQSTNTFAAKRSYFTTYYDAATFNSWNALSASANDSVRIAGAQSTQAYFSDTGIETSYKDGSSATNYQSTTPVLPMGPTLWDFTLDSTTTNQWLILSGTASYAGWLNGALGEMIFTDGTEDLTTQRILEGYLAHKWGTATNLPSSHPYRNEAPGTPGNFGVTNTVATNILSITADLLGSLDATQSVFTVTAYWSTNDHADASAWLSDGTKGTASIDTFTNVMGQSLSASASGLADGTTYYYTFVATNAATNLWASPNASFTTVAADPPVVGTAGGATNIGVGVTTLQGEVTAINGTLSDVRMYFGTTDGGTNNPANWDTNFVVVAGDVAEGVAFATNVTGLLYGQPYTYRVYATNAFGDAWSTAAGFNTQIPGDAGITNTTATNITQAAARLQGTLNATQSVFAVTAYWSTTDHATAVDWLADGTASNMVVGTYTNVVGQSLSVEATGLTDGTIYYYTFVATNAVTNLWATPNASFTTVAAQPPVVGTSGGAANIGVGTAMLQGEVTAINGTLSDVYIYFGNEDGGTNNPANWDTNLVLTAGDIVEGVTFSTNVTDLLYGVEYSYRVYATNAFGESWSDLESFTTLIPSGGWLPLEVGPVAWFDADDFDSFTLTNGNKVSEWVDKSGNNNNASNDVPANQPSYLASDPMVNNKPSVGTNSSAGIVGLLTPTMSAKTIYVVTYYKDGADNAFDTFHGLVTQNAYQGSRGVVANSGTTDLYTGTDYRFNSAGTYKNGTTNSSATVLPLPASILKLKAPVPYSQAYNLGCSANSSGKTWPGYQSEWIFTDGSEDLATEQKIEGYLAHKWGLVGSLPSDHPWKTNNPAIGFSIVTTTATNITAVTADLQGVLDATQSVCTVTTYWSTNDNTDAAAWLADSTKGTALAGAYTNIMDQALSASATGLTDGTIYYYTFVATNAVTNLWATPNASFTTVAAQPPVVGTSGGAANIGVGTAMLQGEVTAINGTLSDVRIYFGTSDGLTTPANWDTNFVIGVGNISEGVTFSTNVTGLLYGQEYAYRVYATNGFGATWSDAETNILTVAPAGIGVTNTTAANVTQLTADLRGELDATQSVFTVTAYWSESNNVNAAAWLADDTKGSDGVGSFTNVMDQALSVSVGSLTPGTTYYYTFVATNVATDIWASPNGSFTAAPSPVLDSVTPANLATEVALDAQLVASFNSVVAVVNGGVVTVTNITDGTATSITLPNAQVTVVDSTNLVIDLTADFAEGKTYAVLIGTSAILAYGGISTTNTWAFTTATPSSTPPELLSLSPTNGATAVDPAVVLTVTFDKDVVANAGNIVITNITSGGTIVIPVTDSQVSFSGAVVTINPTAYLDRAATYAVLIANDIVRDTYGNPFAGITSTATWQFATALPTSGRVLTVLGVTGHNGGSWPASVGHLSDMLNGNLSYNFGTADHYPRITTTANPNDPSVWTYANDSWYSEWGSNEILNPASTINNKIGWAVMDFGGSIEGLANMFLWNKRDNSTTRNTVNYNVYYSSGVGINSLPAMPASKGNTGDYDFSTGDWTQLNTAGVLTLPVNALNNNTPQAILALNGISARYIGIEIITNGGSTANVGLAQVEFTAYDLARPTITNRVPEHNERYVEQDAAIVASFDEPITANTGNIELRLVSGPVGSIMIPVNGAQVTIVGSTMTIQPPSLLTRGAEYAVLIDPGAVTDSSGNGFAGITDTLTWQFKVVGDPEGSVIRFR